MVHLYGGDDPTRLLPYLFLNPVTSRSDQVDHTLHTNHGRFKLRYQRSHSVTSPSDHGGVVLTPDVGDLAAVVCLVLEGGAPAEVAVGVNARAMNPTIGIRVVNRQ